jgi:type 1 glutamine amidotransferase
MVPLLWVLLAWAATTSAVMFAAESPQPQPLLRDRAGIEAVLAKAPPPPPASELRPLRIVLVADEKDHGPNEHDYPLWQKRWKVLLGGKQGEDAETQVNLYGPPAPGDPKVLLSGAPKANVTTAWKWPSREQFQAADLVVMYCYRSGGGHWLWDEQSPKDVDAYLSRGGGFVVIHAATYMHVDMTQPEWKPLLDLTGLAFGKGNRTRRGPMEIRLAADSPICRGLPEVIHLVDEPFWPAYGDRRAVEVLGTSEETVAKDSSELQPQPMFWTYRRGKGRVFGCVPGHFTWTFDDPYFRLLLLRGMAWAAGESPYRFNGLVLRGVSFCGETEQGHDKSQVPRF